MKDVFRPSVLTKLIAFVIILSFVSSYSNGAESHNLVTWALGKSFGATILKALLLVAAFLLACVGVYSKES